MSAHIEWSTLGDTPPRLDSPGEYVDGYGNENDHPALALSSAVLEGPLSEWRPWALGLFDAAREYAADEAGEPEPTPLADLIAAVREVVTRDRHGVVQVQMHTDADERVMALLDALDPEGGAQ